MGDYRIHWMASHLAPTPPNYIVVLKSRIIKICIFSNEFRIKRKSVLGPLEFIRTYKKRIYESLQRIQNVLPRSGKTFSSTTPLEVLPRMLIMHFSPLKITIQTYIFQNTSLGWVIAERQRTHGVLSSLFQTNLSLNNFPKRVVFAFHGNSVKYRVIIVNDALPKDCKKETLFRMTWYFLWVYVKQCEFVSRKKINFQKLTNRWRCLKLVMLLLLKNQIMLVKCFTRTPTAR